MRKLIYILALIASPALADVPMPPADATFEERLEYMRQVRAESENKLKQQVDSAIEQNEQFLKKNQEEIDKLTKAGAKSYRPIPVYVPRYYYRSRFR